tara:strand:+ start:177 stop:542 length:366 start_codon:yes stop_codon:yes gene_type:complete
LEIQTDPSVRGLFRAISFQIVGIAIALMANSANFALLLFADTSGHEIALCAPIIATALFTIVWGDATLQSQVANIKDANTETKKSNAYKFISRQPYNFLRIMNFVLAVTLATSQFSILFGE